MIYFLLQSDNNRVKIGYSKDDDTLKKRLKTHQCGNATALELLALVDGDRHTEARIHKNFKSLRIRGEWFNFDGALRLYVDRLRETRGLTIN